MKNNNIKYQLGYYTLSYILLFIVVYISQFTLDIDKNIAYSKENVNLMLIFILPLLIVFNIISKRDTINISFILKITFIALFIRILFLIIIFSISNNSHILPFAYYDDQTHNNEALKISNDINLYGKDNLLDIYNSYAKTTNSYKYYLGLAYYIFGRSTLVGRLLNIFFSILCVPYIFLISKYLFNNINISKRITLIFVLLPDSIFFSAFEFKDILLSYLTLIIIYETIRIANLKKQPRHSNKSVVFSIATTLLSFYVMNNVRFFIGEMLLLFYWINLYLFLKSKKQFNLQFKLLCAIPLFIILIFSINSYYNFINYEFYNIKYHYLFSHKINYLLDNPYQGGNLIKLSRINELAEIYKLPFSIYSYIVLPIPRPNYDSNRFNFIHPYFHLFWIPFPLFIFIGMYNILKKKTEIHFKIIFIPIILMLISLSIANIGVSRHLFQIQPLLLIIAFYGIYSIKNKIASFLIAYANLIFLAVYYIIKL